MQKTGFPPIADARATILILGSMPGELLLQENQYYANQHNAFWKIMARLLNFEPAAHYAACSQMQIDNKIALWDAIQGCKRQGSLDSAITDASIITNDFASFYRSHLHIKHVIFNGAKAEQEYRKRVLPSLPETTHAIAYARLPSTSPAMAQLSFEQKRLAWADILRKTSA